MIINEIIVGVIALIVGIVLNYYSTGLSRPVDLILKIGGIILVVVGIIMIIAGILGYGILA